MKQKEMDTKLFDWFHLWYSLQPFRSIIWCNQNSGYKSNFYCILT